MIIVLAHATSFDKSISSYLFVFATLGLQREINFIYTSNNAMALYYI